MSTRKKEKKDKKFSLSEEATGGASASVIPDSEQKTHQKGSVSGAGKGGMKGRHMPWKKKVAPPSERPEDEPEICRESVSDVEERVMAECQERIGALEEEVKKLNSEKEEARKSMDERETEMQRVNNENNELRASIKEKEVEMEEKVREGEKSPYSSLSEVKMVVNEDYMTDADKLDLQEMLKQSQEDLEKLWNQNKILAERVRVLEEEVDAQSPADPRAEVDRMRGVLEDREKKIHNLQVQLNSFMQVASGNVALEEQVVQLKRKLEGDVKKQKDNSELVQTLKKEYDSIREQIKILEQEKQVIEDEKDEISAVKEDSEGLQAQIARLSAALSFYEDRYPQGDSVDRSEMKPSDQRELSRKLHKADVAEFRNTILRRESVIKNMQTQRCTLERRMARLEEERARLAEQNLTLLAVKANLNQQMIMKATEVEGLTKEKEMMIQEIKDLQHEIEAEAALTEDFEKERIERENMASRLDELENLKDREQDYEDEIDHLKSSLKHLTFESGQRELQMTVKLEHSIKRAREMEGECSDARDERELAKMEMLRVMQVNEDQKRKHSKELEEAVSSRSEELNTLKGQLLSMQEHVKQMQDENHKNEKQMSQTKRELENQLREIRQRSGSDIEHLKAKLGGLDQQRKHDLADWQRDRNSLEGAIADTAELSDALLSLNQQLKHYRTQAEGYKAKFQEERSKVQLTQEMLKMKEQEHRDEVDLMRAHLKSEKMEQLVAAQNAPSTTQFPDVYKRMPQVNPPQIQNKSEYEVRPYQDKDELSQYELSDVKTVPNSPFSGHGCYGSVTLVRVNEGAKCIEKRLHDILTGYGQHEQVGEQQQSSIEEKFREECLYLSRLRHPNIVQFIGVRYTSGNRLSLIMEFLPATVKGCIERSNKDYFTIPMSAKLAILRDVTYGLIHLHSLSIAHRDLSAANILLTSDLRAKIADLGMSKLLNPAELRRLTKAPGAADIMPPEALQKDCKYTCQIDIFSFGVLSLYLMLQEYPDVCDGWVTPQNVSDKEMEVGKRMGYIEKVPLCQRIIRCCLQDIPERRPRASELKEELETMCERNSPQHGDTVQMLQTIRRLELELTAAKETAPQPQAASHVGGQPYHQPRPGQQYHRYHSDSPYDNKGRSRYPPH